MRFVADESCDFAVVQALRSAGHEIIAVAEVSPRIEDPEVLKLALRRGTVLITEDKDFGQLVYASAKPTEGVLLLRFPARARSRLPAAVLELVESHRAELAGRFVVLQPGRVRMGRSYKR
jgi:predicted nuclease of predicted toxin-antitoxin system